jgi:hypothetical protein
VRLSRRTLTIAILLVGTMIAVSEAPEILTLTNDVSNDCELIQMARQSPRRCIVKSSIGQENPAQALLVGSPSNSHARTHKFLWSSPSRSIRCLLLLLVTLRT